MSHSPLHAPSSAARRLQCPGSAQAEAALPDDESAHTREGTAAHWVLERRIRDGGFTEAGTLTPEGFTVSAEMVDGAELLSDYLRRLGARYTFARAYVETPIECCRIHPNCFGTPDFFGVTEDGTVWVIDYKFGHGFVDEFENAQLVEYASGVLDHLGLDDDRQIVLAVCQPRYYGGAAAVREWRVHGADLRPLWNRLAAAESEAEPTPGAALPRHQTGPECRNCRARLGCQALRRAASGTLEVCTRALPDQLPTDAASLELLQLREAAAIIKARAEALEAHVDAALRRGEAAPFHTLEQGAPGKLVWSRPAAEVLAMGKLMGADLARPQEPITPTQAKKVICEAAINAYASRAPAGLVLAPISAAKARRIFYK